MKISINDPSNDSKLMCPWLTAFLDGEEMKYVVAADEEAGEVVRYALGVDGKPIWNHDKQAFDTLKGKVEIRLQDNAPPDQAKLYADLRALEAGV